MSQDGPTRREWLGLVGALAATLALPARAGEPDLVTAMRERLLGFDLGDLIRKAADDLKLPRKWRARLELALTRVDLTGGFRRLQDIDEDALRPLLDLGEQALASLGFKLWMLRTAKRTPDTPAARDAMVEHVLRDWFELDMDGLRAAVDELEQGRLAIVYGPVSDLLEAGGVILHEPFALFTQLVHGRKATEFFLEKGDAARRLLDILFSPDHDVVVLIGHGTWTSFELVGFSKRPRKLLADLCDRLLADPKEGLRALAKGSLYYVYKRRVPRGSLQEEDLARLFDQVYPPGPERDRRQKALVVRHTCGSQRYATEGADLLWKLAPEEIEDTIEIDGDHFSAATPAIRPEFEAALGGWLADKDVPIVERAAFGTCLVADPAQTRGYEGISWMADFLEDPLPRLVPRAPFAVAPEPPATVAED